MRVSLSHVRPRAIIYDHDGTLVDSLDVVVAATNAVLEKHGKAAQPRDAIIQGMVEPTPIRMGLLLSVADVPARQRLAAEFYQAAQAFSPRQVRAYPGITELLVTARGLGIAQGVVSNNQGNFVRNVLAHLGLGAHFSAVVGEEDMPAPKPDPRGLLAVAQSLQRERGAVWYVGDTVGDLHTAQAAGMPCIGVTWGITPRETLTQHGFLAVIDTPQQLLALIAAQNSR